jgi:hypothetical protein
MTNTEVLDVPEVEDIPVLKGWISLPALGDKLDVTRQRVYQMALNERKFASIHQIPGAAPDEPGKRQRPAAYVVSTEEAERFLAAQRDAIAARAAREATAG